MPYEIRGIKLKLFATLEKSLAEDANAYRIDVATYSAVFEKNNIPQGSILLPVGLNLSTLDLADAHKISVLAKLRTKAKIYIYLQAAVANPALSGVAAFGVADFIDSPKLIFRGNITGIGYRRANNNVQMVVNFSHWLAKLNNSSSISALSHPGNHTDFTARSGAALPGDCAQAATQSVATEAVWSLRNVLATQLNASSDLWNDVIKPFLLCITKAEPIDLRLAERTGLILDGSISPAQQDRIAAVERIVAKVPITIKESNDTSLLVQNISLYLNAGISEEWVHNTLWGKLVGDWCPNLFLNICPRIDDAVIAPLLPVSSLQTAGATYKKINPQDYYSADLSLGAKQSIRAVAIAYPTQPNTDTQERITSGSMAEKLAGVWPENNYNDGVIIVKLPPQFLIPPQPNGGSLEQNRGDMYAPVATSGTAGVQLSLDSRAISEFARYWYITEVFSGRAGEISGKLRFDICPGSLVELEVLDTATLATSGSVSFTKYYAQVLRTSFTIDAVSGQAATVFTVDNVHLENELSDPNLVGDGVPMYTNAWAGGTMADYITR